MTTTSTQIKIAICGGGSLGHVTSGYLASKPGVIVAMLTRHPHRWASTLEITDINGKVFNGPLSLVSDNPAEVLRGAQIVLLCLPGYAIERTLETIKPFIEPQTLVGSIKKGLRLGFGTWGGTVGVMFILSFIINIVTQFTALPWTLMFIVKMVFGLGIDGLDGTWTENVFYTFGYYLTAVLQCFTSYVASTGLIVGAAYLYGHAAEKMDGITVEDNIRNFGNLGATN